MPEFSKEEMRQRVTDRILSALSGGKIPWVNPVVRRTKHGGMPFNMATDRRYNGGLNNILLMFASLQNGWNDPRWIGRGQARKKGWNIEGLKNSVATEIFAPIMKKFKNEDGEWVEFCKGWRPVFVFNAQQMKEIPSFSDFEIPNVNPEEGFASAQALLDKANPRLIWDISTIPCYVPSRDTIRSPKPGQFNSVDQYWSTMMHELVHWTGAKSRLDRIGIRERSITEVAFEELVAEMGSAFLCAHLGIDRPEVTENHEAYIQSWIKHLKNDNSAFHNAAKDAWKAFEFLS